MTGTFAMPNIVFDDPYFTKEKRVFSRVEALAWIAKHVRWTDNCVLKKGDGQWSLSFLATAWGWCVSKVRRFLKRLEEANVIRTARDTASGIAQIVITYLFSGTYKTAKSAADTEPTVDRHSSDTKTNSGNPGKKEDSPLPQGGGTRIFSGEIPELDGAGPSESVAPEPQQQPTEEAVPPNSAAPPRRTRVVPDYTPEFDAMWATIPQVARRSGKKKPFEVWRQLTAGQRAQVVLGAVLWARRVKDKDPKFIEMAQTWFNQARWETESETVCDGKRASDDAHNKFFEEAFS